MWTGISPSMRHLFIDLGHSIRFPGAKGVMAEIVLYGRSYNHS